MCGCSISPGVCFIQEEIYDQTPKSRADRTIRCFQRLEYVEKMMEIADECFHLLGPLLKHMTTALVYQQFSNAHHAAHTIEHMLHPCCFLGDVTRLILGDFAHLTKQRFVVYRHQKGKENGEKKVNFALSAIRISHAIGHFFAAASFLSQVQLYSFGSLETVFKYAPLVNGTSFAFGTIYFIWKRHIQREKLKKQQDLLKKIDRNNNLDDYLCCKKGIAHLSLKEDQSTWNLGACLGGALFEIIPLSKNIASLAPYAYIANKIASLAGIIHAGCSVQCLMPDRQKVKFEKEEQE